MPAKLAKKKTEQTVALDGSGPIYKQIERAVRGEILSGRWPPGHRIPPEHTLLQWFSTTRATVSKALSKLTEAGLLERRRKQGTIVAQTTESHAVIGYLDIRKEIEAKGREYSYRVLRATSLIAGPRTTAWPEVPPGTPILHLQAVHNGFGKPEVLEERFINLAAAPDAVHADFEAETPNIWLLARLPCTRLRHSIKAEIATAEQAQQLQIPVNGPLLVSRRRTWADALPVTWVKLTYPGERNEFVGEFNPLDS
ncbi:MAG TPA: UTRA domain-containing protein [Nordella sp.]|nr:UTRA domain-containing protein [Nordella sp.]